MSAVKILGTALLAGIALLFAYSFLSALSSTPPVGNEP